MWKGKDLCWGPYMHVKRPVVWLMGPAKGSIAATCGPIGSKTIEPRLDSHHKSLNCPKRRGGGLIGDSKKAYVPSQDWGKEIRDTETHLGKKRLQIRNSTRPRKRIELNLFLDYLKFMVSSSSLS